MLRAAATALLLGLHCADAWVTPLHSTHAGRLNRPVLLCRHTRGSSVLRLKAAQGGLPNEASVQKGISFVNGVIADPSGSMSNAVKTVNLNAVGTQAGKLQQELQGTAAQTLKSFSALPVAQQGAIASLGVFALVIITMLASGGSAADDGDSPYPAMRYDAKTAEEYFNRHPVMFWSRALEIFSSAAGFGLALLLDLATGNLKKNEDSRADELSSLLSRLGPTFIKLGQSLSIRTDLLSPAYVRGLTALQDKVPSFPTEIARKTIEKELGQPVESLFTGLTEPVAAASLGQVYKATLADGSGREVAVKVQRPDIMTRIALDMHLIRVAEPLFRLAGYVGDVKGLVDDWGTGFVNELDYIAEAVNGEQFMADMAKTPLAGVVFAPPVYKNMSTGRVLVTQWIDGERLEKSGADDVASLCSVAMNCYLTMMLESGTMHCDPHPGNLLRSPDGRLCILDWGLVQTINPDLRLTFIEHIAHLTSKDYEKVPADLIKLGFVPEGKEAEIQDREAVDVVASVYAQMMVGGGAANIDVNRVLTELQDLTDTYGQLFQLPPYFAYIARAFSTLEGIGLGNDPSYNIVDECLPYISQRLLTDPDPRTGGALNKFIFGKDSTDPERLVDIERLENLLDGFSSYSTSAGGAALLAQRSTAQVIEEAADQLAALLLAEDQTPIQTIVLEQMARVVNSGARGAFRAVRERSGRLRNGRTVLGTLVDPLGLFRNSPVLAVQETDERAIEATQKLIFLLRKQPIGNTLQAMSPREVQQVAAVVARKLWQRRSALLLTGNRFATTVLKQTLERLDQEPVGRWAPRAEIRGSREGSTGPTGTARR